MNTGAPRRSGLGQPAGAFPAHAVKAVNAAGMYCVGLETTNPHDVVAEYADMVIDNYLDTDDKEGNGKYNKLMGLFV